MSYNIPLVDSTEDNNQDQKIAQTKVPSLDESVSASKTVTEKTEKLDGKKRSVPSLEKSGSASKTETERTEKHDSKKNPYNYPVQMIKNWQNRTQKTRE